jgi:transcriptional regulator with XRE-family HTH domain
MRDVLVQLGKRIRALREERKISQEELADRADIHRNYISQIEGGKRNVSFYYVVKIARALQVSPSRLIDRIS